MRCARSARDQRLLAQTSDLTGRGPCVAKAGRPRYPSDPSYGPAADSGRLSPASSSSARHPPGRPPTFAGDLPRAHQLLLGAEPCSDSEHAHGHASTHGAVPSTPAAAAALQQRRSVNRPRPSRLCETEATGNDLIGTSKPGSPRLNRSRAAPPAARAAAAQGPAERCETPACRGWPCGCRDRCRARLVVLRRSSSFVDRVVEHARPGHQCSGLAARRGSSSGPMARRLARRPAIWVGRFRRTRTGGSAAEQRERLWTNAAWFDGHRRAASACACRRARARSAAGLS
jgi:hypothetical protein